MRRRYRHITGRIFGFYRCGCAASARQPAAGGTERRKHGADLYGKFFDEREGFSVEIFLGYAFITDFNIPDFVFSAFPDGDFRTGFPFGVRREISALRDVEIIRRPTVIFQNEEFSFRDVGNGKRRMIGNDRRHFHAVEIKRYVAGFDVDFDARGNRTFRGDAVNENVSPLFPRIESPVAADRNGVSVGIRSRDRHFHTVPVQNDGGGQFV